MLCWIKKGEMDGKMLLLKTTRYGGQNKTSLNTKMLNSQILFVKEKTASEKIDKPYFQQIKFGIEIQKLKAKQNILY